MHLYKRAVIPFSRSLNHVSQEKLLSPDATILGASRSYSPAAEERTGTMGSLNASFEVTSSHPVAGSNGAAPVDIPAKPENSDTDHAEVMSLPTPRSLRLLGSELFLNTHFPDHIRSRQFSVGERVQADWNSFGSVSASSHVFGHCS